VVLVPEDQAGGLDVAVNRRARALEEPRRTDPVTEPVVAANAHAGVDEAATTVVVVLAHVPAARLRSVRAHGRRAVRAMRADETGASLTRHAERHWSVRPDAL